MTIATVRIVSRFLFREFRETRQARNAAVPRCASLAQPMETGVNGRLTREGNGKTLAHRHDVTVFSGALEMDACGPTSPPPSLPLPCRFSRPLNCRFPRGVPL